MESASCRAHHLQLRVVRPSAQRCAHALCADALCADGLCADGLCADALCADGLCADGALLATVPVLPVVVVFACRSCQEVVVFVALLLCLAGPSCCA